MPSIDERVVAMAFENQRFEMAIAQTMKTLDQLNKALASVGAQSGFDKLEGAANKVTLQGPMSALDKLKQKLGMAVDTKPITDIEGAANKVTLQGPMSAIDRLRQKLGFVGDTKGFADIEGSANRVDFSNLTNSIDGIGSHFSALQAMAFGVFASIGAKITALGSHLAHGFALGPITEGFHNYETQIDAVQTITANTGLTGKKGLGQITSSLNELNKYANLTIYNFSEMARNIGTFTAAGVQLKPAVAAIKGIANLGALSGSTSAQVSSAMYQLSQALAAGQVHLQDWNSVVNAGMGGRRFQQMLVETGIAMGKLNGNQVKFGKQLKVNGGTFRESLQTPGGAPSWLTSDVLSQALQNFTGDMTKAQLASKGYNAAQIKDIQNTAKLANQSATQIKTFSQMLQALKEETASSWAQLWKSIFGDLPTAKALFSPLHIAIENMLRNPIDAFTKQLQGWSKMGGRTMLFSALKTGFKDLGQIIHAVHQAFRDIFPPQTSKGLLEMTKHFSHFINTMKASPQTLENIRKTFRGFFAVLSIGWYIVKKVAGVIFDLLGVAKGGAGGFLSLTGGIGEFFTGLQKAIVKGDALAGFFNGLTKILSAPLSLLRGLANAIGHLFSGVDTKSASKVGGAVSGITSQLPPLNQMLKRAGQIGKRIVDTVNKVFDPLSKAVSFIGHALVNIGRSIADTFEHANFDNVFGVIQTALAGGIFFAIKKALGQPIDFLGSIGGTLTKIKGVLSGVTTNLQEMQHLLKATTLLAIGAAIISLAVGIKILAGIDPKRLTVAMTAVGIGLGQLVAAMALLARMPMGGASLLAVSAGMVAIASAVTILAVAMKILATIPEKEMTRALVGIAGALVSVGLATKLMGPELTLTAPGLLATAFALVILAGAMKIFGSMKWGDLAKGIIGIGGALVALGIGVATLGPELLLVGPGLIIASAGLLLLAGALAAFGNMKTLDLIQGIIGINAALVTLGVSIGAFPPTLALQAAGLVILAIALVGIAGAVKAFGSMDLGTIVKGIVAMGASLVVLAIGLAAMAPTLPGSVALLAAAAAFAVLAPVLAILGSMSWGTMLKGLAAMVGVLLVLGTVGGIAAAGLTALGIGLGAVGVGVTIIGAGIYLIAKALVLLGNESIKSTGVVIAAITAFIAVIPKMLIDFMKGLVQTMGAMADLAPKVVDSLSKIINSFLDVILKILPKVKQLVDELMIMFIDTVNNHSSQLIEAGWKLLLNFLSGIDRHIHAVVTHVANIVTKFLNTIADRMPGVIHAGARVIISFLSGVAKHIGHVVVVGGRVIRNFLRGIARAIPGVVGGVTDIIVHFLNAVGKNLPRIARAGVRLARRFIRAVADALVALADVGAHAIIRFMNRLAKVIHDNAADFAHAGFNIGKAIITGVLQGMATLRKDASDSLNEAIFGNDRKLKKKDIEYIQRAKAKGVKRSQLEGSFTEAELDAVYGKKPKHHAAAKASAAPAHKAALDTIGVSPNPKITPVLDLSQVKKKSGELNNLTRPKQVAHVSLAHASAASRGHAAVHAQQAHHKQAAVRPVQFVQNNTSPKSLSTREIYRRTHNQLSHAKKKLGIIDGGVLLAGE